MGLLYKKVCYIIAMDGDYSTLRWWIEPGSRFRENAAAQFCHIFYVIFYLASTSHG